MPAATSAAELAAVSAGALPGAVATAASPGTVVSVAHSLTLPSTAAHSPATAAAPPATNAISLATTVTAATAAASPATAAPTAASAGISAADSPALLEEVRSLIKENYLYPVSDDVLKLDTAEAIISALGDPYSEYLSDEELTDLMESTSGSYAGVGMELFLQSYKGILYPTVASTFPGSPARQAGIVPGDRIIAVNGYPTWGRPLEETVSLIKGDPGTNVNLTVSREGINFPFLVKLVRENIHLNVVTYEALGDRIGYIKISVFSADSAEQVKEAVEALLQQGCDSLILDLRDNPGGYLDAGLETAELFIPEGFPLMHFRSRQENSVFVSEGRSFAFPLAVLINGESASAAEIVAGAIKDYRVGTLIGTTTFGKGTVQTVQTLEAADAAVKLTVAEFLSPKKIKIDGIGIAADFVVEGSQQQLDAAKKVLKEQIKSLRAKGKGTRMLLPETYQGAVYQGAVFPYGKTARDCAAARQTDYGRLKIAFSSSF